MRSDNKTPKNVPRSPFAALWFLGVIVLFVCVFGLCRLGMTQPGSLEVTVQLQGPVPPPQPVTLGSFTQDYIKEMGLLGPGVEQARRNWQDERSNSILTRFLPHSGYPVEQPNEQQNQVREREMNQLRRTIADANRRYYQQELAAPIPYGQPSPYRFTPVPVPQNLWSSDEQQLGERVGGTEQQPEMNDQESLLQSAQTAGSAQSYQNTSSSQTVQSGQQSAGTEQNLRRPVPKWFRSSNQTGTNPGFGPSRPNTASMQENVNETGPNRSGNSSYLSGARSVGSDMLNDRTQSIDEMISESARRQNPLIQVPQTPEQLAMTRDKVLQKFQNSLEEMIIRSPDIHLLAPVEVKYEDGTVTLRGVVENEQQRVKAGQILLTVPEVKRVKNLMTAVE
ncbi:MAG: BON domain-containing protein [Thermoguttaceae bacterium]